MRWADALLGHRRAILVCAVLAAALCLVLMQTVSVNYSLSDYLPKDAPSTLALDAMGGAALPALNVYAPVHTIPEALDLKARLLGVRGVLDVLWLDDTVDVTKPLETQNAQAVAAWFSDQGALYRVTANTKDDIVRIVSDVRAQAGEGALLSGDTYNMALVQGQNMAEISRIMLYVLPLVLLVLLLTTGSWFEPVLFLVCIGLAILFNEGTNAFLGEVSFVTQATSAVLQLAVSMDYAIFLLHRFTELRDAGMDTLPAMREAMVRSFPTILGSALTTVFGFLSLVLMRFEIGGDMGVVLSKGVLLSFLTVMLVLPVLAVLCEKVLAKTRHRPLFPTMRGFSRFVMRVCVPVALVVLILLVPAFIAQSRNTFIYGSEGMNGEHSPAAQDARRIAEMFGGGQQMALSVPAGDPAREQALHETLKAIPRVADVTSFVSMVGAPMPLEMLTDANLSQLVSGGMTRFIITADVPAEGDASFQVVKTIREETAALYGEGTHLLGECAVNADLKTVITGDALAVQLGAILTVGLVLLFIFKSVSLPILLLATIEGAIFINMSLPYFMGASMNYIGYQIISAVQLGATVDYGILLVGRYMEFRRTAQKREAVRMAVQSAASSILSPVSILVIAGTVLSIISTNGVISQMGGILARGAAISGGMVLLVLPALLCVCDRLIQNTTLRASFLKKEEPSA